MSDILNIARERLRDEPPRTHWGGCESAHDACLIAKLAAEVERLRADNQALAHALRLFTKGRPVRNADELLARAALREAEGT